MSSDSDPQPTVDLDTFRAAWGEDDNEFWRLSSGDHLNLLDDACGRLDRLDALVELLHPQEMNQVAYHLLKAALRDDQ